MAAGKSGAMGTYVLPWFGAVRMKVILFGLTVTSWFTPHLLTFSFHDYGDPDLLRVGTDDDCGNRVA